MHRSGFYPRALRKYRLFESTDLDETRERISRVMQPHSLIPSDTSTIRSHMDFVRIGSLGIGTIAFGAPVRVDVEAVSDYYLLMFCLSGEAEVSVAGKPVLVNSRHAILRAPGEPFSATLSRGCEQLVMRIDPASIAGEASGAPPRFASLLPLLSDRMRAWKDQLLLVASSPDLLESACANPHIGANLEALLVSLLAPLSHSTHETGTDRPVTPHFVLHAEDLMRENLTLPLQLKDIAVATGVSVRTLCFAFQRFRNIGPMQKLKELRLDRARREIIATSCGQRIADIASNCGFNHLGRFAISYKERFGESPSDTARRR